MVNQSCVCPEMRPGCWGDGQALAIVLLPRGPSEGRGASHLKGDTGAGWQNERPLLRRGSPGVGRGSAITKRKSQLHSMGFESTSTYFNATVDFTFLKYIIHTCGRKYRKEKKCLHSPSVHAELLWSFHIVPSACAPVIHTCMWPFIAMGLYCPYEAAAMLGYLLNHAHCPGYKFASSF